MSQQVPWLGAGRPLGAKLRHLARWSSVKLTLAALRDARGGAPGGDRTAFLLAYPT